LIILFLINSPGKKLPQQVRGKSLVGEISRGDDLEQVAEELFVGVWLAGAIVWRRGRLFQRRRIEYKRVIYLQGRFPYS